MPLPVLTCLSSCWGALLGPKALRKRAARAAEKHARVGSRPRKLSWRTTLGCSGGHKRKELRAPWSQFFVSGPLWGPLGRNSFVRAFWGGPAQTKHETKLYASLTFGPLDATLAELSGGRNHARVADLLVLVVFRLSRALFGPTTLRKRAFRAA